MEVGTEGSEDLRDRDCGSDASSRTEEAGKDAEGEQPFSRSSCE